jgi:8-oxo-dGTP pyrophosphatase MutT (NUDIX family)
MGKYDGQIEVLARGACVINGRLLLCHSKGAANTYLPGGHVEFRERAPEALRREIEEELGRNATVGRFLGGVEHAFVQKGVPHAEVNLVFEITVGGLTAGVVPSSKEEKIEFLWADLAGLDATALEPAVLRRVLPGWLDPSFRGERWASW